MEIPGRLSSEAQVEQAAQRAAAGGGELDRPRAADAAHPVAGEGEADDLGCEGAGHVVAALAPVEAGVGDAAAAGTEAGDVDTELGETVGPSRGDGVFAAGKLDPLLLEQGVGQGDAELAGKVVVARARVAQGPVGCCRTAAVAGRGGAMTARASTAVATSSPRRR